MTSCLLQSNPNLIWRGCMWGNVALTLPPWKTCFTFFHCVRQVIIHLLGNECLLLWNQVTSERSRNMKKAEMCYISVLVERTKQCQIKRQIQVNESLVLWSKCFWFWQVQTYCTWILPNLTHWNNRWMNEWMDRWMDQWINGRMMDRWINGWMDR